MFSIVQNSQLKRINGIISDDLKKQLETQNQNNQRANINPSDYVFDHEMVIKEEIKEESAETVIKKEIKEEKAE